MPVGVGAGDRHVNAPQGIHDLAETVEVHHSEVVNADAQVVQESILERGRPAARVMVYITELVSGVDALHPVAGDVDPQVARDGDQRHLPGLGPERGDDDGICAEGSPAARIGTEQGECDRLSVGQDRERGWGVIGGADVGRYPAGWQERRGVWRGGDDNRGGRARRVGGLLASNGSAGRNGSWRSGCGFIEQRLERRRCGSGVRRNRHHE